MFYENSISLFLKISTLVESIFEEIKKMRADTPEYRLAYLRMAIYFAENEQPDPKMLHPSVWAE